jgi:uncharacterized protein YqhQ
MAVERNPAQKDVANISGNNFILLTILILVFLFLLLNLGTLIVL